MNIIGGIKLYDGNQRLFLTTGERHQFREATGSLQTMEGIFCRFLYYTGCKLSEASEVYPDQINYQNGQVRFHGNGERLKARTVPVPPLFCIEISTYLRGELQNTSNPLWSISRATGWRLIKKVMKNAGITGQQATPTGLRHSFAISCLEMSPPIPLHVLQGWIGHRRLELTASYLNAFKYNETEYLKQLWNYY